MLSTHHPHTRHDTDLYLDSNATTPVLPLAQAAAQQVMMANFGNPSSTHSTGLRARAVLDASRAMAEQVLGAAKGRVFFTSGATEGIQTAVLSALSHLAEQRATGQGTATLLLYGATEHKAVPEALKHWNRVLHLNCEIMPIPVSRTGTHDLAFIASHAPRAALVCTMAVNNETGVISDLAGIAAALGESSALWLVDSVQALGKLPLNLAQTRIDYAPFSGHKLYAPKGIGMLYVRPGAPFTPLMVGGGQETGQRGGTENLPGIAALGAVLKALHEGDPVFHPHDVLEQYRAKLADSLRQAFPGLVFNAGFDNAVSTTLNFSVPGLSSKEMLDLFDASGVRVSSGSACNSNKVVRSFVLDAMQLDNWQVTSAVRMSFGPATSSAEIEDACQRIVQAGAAIRNACLLFGGESGDDAAQTPANGVIRLMFDSGCSWIYCDADSRQCVIIDPLPELLERIARWVACRNLPVLAVLATDSAHAACRLALQQKLGDKIAQTDTDPLGWPMPDPAQSASPANPANAPGQTSLTLADGSHAPALALGSGWLINLAATDGEKASYLIATAGSAQPDSIRFAFVGDHLAEHKARLTPLVAKRTLLLSAHDQWQEFASTLDEQPAAADAHAGAPGDVNLPGQQIRHFLDQHPNAWVVDVRETYEHGMGPGLPGLQLHNAPLSRLPQFLPDWLENEQQELLFICRSGARSALAAACLRRLGHQRAWHLVGGLALQ
jgi:cysteine sulfinate desulfinase/cysteine desulfurase-like protein/rhodanese-related sulfurtransferase